jgi:hypothetical protein
VIISTTSYENSIYEWIQMQNRQIYQKHNPMQSPKSYYKKNDVLNATCIKTNQRQVWISLNSSLQERQVSQTANMLTYTSTDNLRYNKQIASKSPSNPYSLTNFLQYWTTNKSHLMASGFEMAPTRKFDPSMTSN